MSIINKLKSLFHTTDDTKTPVPAIFATRNDVVYAPISGMLVSRREINDEIISEGMLGEGYGILPVGNIIYAPANGRVDMTTVTDHAIGLLTASGAKVIIHAGIGTVDMDGKGFTRYVEVGDTVAAGQPLISFDVEAIRAAGHDEIVTCVISNPQSLEAVHLVGSSNTLLGGRPLVKVGDPLIVTE